MADHHHRPVIELGEPADDGGPRAAMPVAVKFLEILKHMMNVIQGVGAAGVAGHLGFLPSVKTVEDIPLHVTEFFLQLGDIVSDVTHAVIHMGQ